MQVTCPATCMYFIDKCIGTLLNYGGEFNGPNNKVSE